MEASTEARDGVAVLIVQDFGPGIPPELSARVFERFVRGGRDGAKGSGLGLAIVRSVAQSHGGTVELETPAGGVGTRFVIRIPTPHVPREEAPLPEPAENGAAQTSTTTGRTIGRRRSRS